MAEPAADQTGPDSAPRARPATVVLVGLAAAGAAAFAGSRAWVSLAPSGDGVTDAAIGNAVASARDASAPPVTALALVLLAAWGVVLVTRGRVRLAVAWLGVVAALGVLGFAVAAWVVAPDAVTRDLPTVGVETSHTVWSYVGVVGGVLGLAAAVLAARGVRGWAEMGRRYDAPADAAPTLAAGDDASNLELWKAIDEGRDPTAEPGTHAGSDTGLAPRDEDGGSPR